MPDGIWLEKIIVGDRRITMVVDPTCPPDVMRMLNRDGSGVEINVKTGMVRAVQYHVQGRELAR